MHTLSTQRATAQPQASDAGARPQARTGAAREGAEFERDIERARDRRAGGSSDAAAKPGREPKRAASRANRAAEAGESGDAAATPEEAAVALLPTLGLPPGLAAAETSKRLDAGSALELEGARAPSPTPQAAPATTRDVPGVSSVTVEPPGAAAAVSSAPDALAQREPTATIAATAETPQVEHANTVKPLTEVAEKPVERAPQPTPPAPLAEQRAADIVRQVRLQLLPAERQATIQLDPPELGRIAIRVLIRRGQVDAELKVEQRATLDALVRYVPELKAALARDGLTSGSFDLQLGFGGRRRDDDAPPRGARAPQAASIEAPRALQLALARRLGRDSAIDTYA